MSAFDFTFEELPLFRTDDGMFTALVNGSCDVSFTGPDDFDISDIYLIVDNGRSGLEMQAKAVAIKMEDGPAFWCRVHNAIVERYRDQIEERIAEELADTSLPRLISTTP